MTAFVFYAHSGVTQICADLISATVARPTDRVVVISSRGNWSVAGARTLALSDDDPSVRHPIEARRYQRSLFDRITALTESDPFRLFVPQSHSLKLRLIQRHPQCAELNYIEEGVGSYFFIEDIQIHRHSPAGRVAKSLGLAASFRMWGLSKQAFFDPSFEGHAYKIGARAFPWTDRGVLLSYQPTRVEGLPDHVMVMDWIDPTQPQQAREYFARVRELISLLCERGVNSLLVKFHPGNTTAAVEAAVEFIDRSDAVSLRIAPASLNFERVAKGRIVFGGLSSALMYAALLGGQGFLNPWSSAPSEYENRVALRILREAGVRDFSEFEG